MLWPINQTSLISWRTFLSGDLSSGLPTGLPLSLEFCCRLSFSHPVLFLPPSEHQARMIFSRSPCFRWHSPFLLDRQPLPSAFLLCLHSSPCLILRESKLTTPVLHITVCSFRDFEQILIWDNRKTLHLTFWYTDATVHSHFALFDAMLDT